MSPLARFQLAQPRFPSRCTSASRCSCRSEGSYGSQLRTSPSPSRSTCAQNVDSSASPSTIRCRATGSPVNGVPRVRVSRQPCHSVSAAIVGQHSSSRSPISRRPLRPVESTVSTVAASTRKSSTEPDGPRTGVSRTAGRGSRSNTACTASTAEPTAGSWRVPNMASGPAHSRTAASSCSRERGVNGAPTRRRNPMTTAASSAPESPKASVPGSSSAPSAVPGASPAPRTGSQARDPHRSGGSPISR